MSGDGNAAAVMAALRARANGEGQVFAAAHALGVDTGLDVVAVERALRDLARARRVFVWGSDRAVGRVIVLTDAPPGDATDGAPDAAGDPVPVDRLARAAAPVSSTAGRSSTRSAADRPVADAAPATAVPPAPFVAKLPDDAAARRAAIEAAVAAGRVRRLPLGMGIDAVRDALVARGHVVQRKPGRDFARKRDHAPWRLDGAPATDAALIAALDRHRAAEGLPPLAAPPAPAAPVPA